AVTRQSNPPAIIGLDGQMQVELHAPISADSQIVEAMRPAREAPFTASINRKVKSGSLQWNRFPTSKESIHAHAIVRNSGEIEFLLVDLLALHCSILCHFIFHSVLPSDHSVDFQFPIGITHLLPGEIRLMKRIFRPTEAFSTRTFDDRCEMSAGAGDWQVRL